MHMRGGDSGIVADVLWGIIVGSGWGVVRAIDLSRPDINNVYM